MGLALLLSQLYRQEFYGQKDASLTGQELSAIGVDEDAFAHSAPPRHGGGGHGGSRSGGRDGGKFRKRR